MPTSQSPFQTQPHRFCRFAALVIAAALSLGGIVQAGEDPFQARAQVTLPGGQKITSFDRSFDDPTIQVYFLADQTNSAVDLIDTPSATVLVQLRGTPPFSGATGNDATSGPNGLTVVNHRELWAGDGASQVKVINLFSQQTTHLVITGGAFRVRDLCFDSRDQLVLAVNDSETPFPFISIISTANYSILQKIVMNGTTAGGGSIQSPAATNGIGQCQYDAYTHQFYVNIPEVNGPGNDTQPGAVVTISPQTMQITNVFSVPISQCAGPAGMAVGPFDQILLGCVDPNKTVPSTVIINDVSGAVVASVSGEDGADQVWYNPSEVRYFLARSSGLTGLTLAQQLGVVNATGHTAQPSTDTGLPNLPTSPHGLIHSVAVDSVFNQIYVPIPGAAGLTVCSGAGGSDAQGCIAIFTPTH